MRKTWGTRRPIEQKGICGMVDKGPASGLFETSSAATPTWFGIGQLGSKRDVAAVIAIFAFLAMVFLGPIMTLSDTASTGDSGNTVRQIGYFLIFLLAIWAADPLRRGWSVLAVPVPVLVALAWCWLSLAWAVEPGIGFRRLLLTSMVVWTCFIIVHGAGYKLTLGTMRMALAAALVVNFAVVFAEPDVGIHGLLQNGEETALIGNWRGFMAHKNFAGAACALTIILFTFDARDLLPKVRIGVIALAAVFLYKSSSKTSAGMALIAMASAYAFQRVPPKMRIYVIPALALLSVVLGVLMSLYGDALSSALANPMVFTGRGVIWAALLNYTRDNPITGAGFGSFWNIGFDSPIYQYGKGFATIVTVGHNGYLDLAATVGIPGTLLIVFALIVWPMIRLLASHGGRSDVGALTCAIIVFGVGHNVTESSMFARDAIVGVFMLLAVAFTATLSLSISERSKPLRGKGSAGDELMRTMRKRKRPA